MEIPQGQEQNLTPTEERNDLCIQASFWNGLPQSNQVKETFKSIRIDTVLSMFISTKRNYKVLIRAFPDSGGQCLVDHGSESQPPPSLANWFPENHLIRMNAHAKPNCIFIHWTINDQFESDLDTLSYEVKRPAEINAVFMPTSTVRVATWPDTTLEISIIDSTSPAPWFRTFLFKDSLQIQTPNIQERNRFTFISGAETQYIFMNWKGRDPGPSMVETTIDTPVTVTAEIRTQYCVIWKSNGI